MRLLSLRYEGNLAYQQFVVSDKVASDFLDAFEAANHPTDVVAKVLSPIVTVVDEAEPLPPFEPDPENPGRRDMRRRFGAPGSEARINLLKVAAVRSGPVPPVNDD